MEMASEEKVVKFLKEFVPDQGSPTGEENVNIQLRSSIVGSYRLSQADIYPEVLDWVSSYLDQKKCPNELATVLANEVATFTKDSFPIDENKQDPDDEFLFDSVLLYNNVLEKLIELCNKYQNTPDEILSKTRNIQSAKYLASINAIKNGRRKMEDRHVVIHDLNALCGLEKSPPHSYYAIFDGHAGVEAASYAASHLHWNIVKHPSFASDLETAIKEAYLQTDEAFLERSKRDNIKSGCTAVTCIIRDKTLYVAWLGDSLAILVRQGMPCISLVEPHKPDRLEEKERIEKLGGVVAFVGTWRVNGTLAVSRAIGDIEHKPVVSGVPEIQKISLEGDEDFLVIGCDGLWDNMSPQDVSATVYSKATDLTADADSIASAIVQQSKNQGSTDNITAIVVLFRDRASLTQPITPHYKQNSDPFDAFTPNGKMEHHDFGQDGPLSNNPFSQNWMDNPTESLESGKSIYVYNSGITVGDPIGANGPEEIFRPFTGVTLERTSISELPTPPIEDLAPTQQFSNLESLNSQSLDQSQNSNPFNDVTDFSERSMASFFDASIENTSVTSSTTESFDFMGGGQLKSTSEQTITSESQSSLMMSSQSGQSTLSAVLESEDQILASKPWVMQVEHSLNQNEVDYLPNPDSVDLQNLPGDSEPLMDNAPDSIASQLYDFSTVMNLEEVPLDMPVGAETEASFNLNKSLEGQNQELASSFSEEAHSTIRAIHGVQEMIGISESVPGSKAQDPPATAGSPFSDNPFNIPKAFDDDITNPETENQEYNLEQEIMEKNDVVGDLFGARGGAYVDHESLIESNVDPDDDVLDHEEANSVIKVTTLPDVLNPTIDSVKASTQDLEFGFASDSNLKEESIDTFDNSAPSQVPINNPESPTENISKRDNPNLLDDLVETKIESFEPSEETLVEGTQDLNIDVLPSMPTNILVPETSMDLFSFSTTQTESKDDLMCNTIPQSPKSWDDNNPQEAILEPNSEAKGMENISSALDETPIMDLLNEASHMIENSQIVETETQQESNLEAYNLDNQSSTTYDQTIFPDVVETLAENTVETLVETPTENTVEALVETPTENTVEALVETPTENTVEALVETPTENTVEALVETPTENTVEALVETPAENAVEALVETPAENAVEAIVETPAGNTVEAIVETIAENTVEALVETPAGKMFETLPAENSFVETLAENTVQTPPDNTIETLESPVKSLVETVESITTPTEELPVSETVVKEELSPTFAAQPETVKVDFSPTLNSEPTISILSPIIGAVPAADIIPSAQDTLTAPVVQLGKIPDGVPEADGVTEDVDSDSEKDGGWSYVKGNDGKQVEKVEKKDEKKVASKSPIKKPPTSASTLPAKKMTGKDVSKPSAASSTKTLKPDDKAKKASLSTASKPASATLAPVKKTTAETIKRTTSATAVKSTAPAVGKTLKQEKPKMVGNPSTTSTLKASKPTSAGSASPKPLNSTTIKSTSTLKSGTSSSTKTVSSTATGLASKTVTKAPVKTPETSSTLNKPLRPTTGSNLVKTSVTKAATARPAGSAGTITARAVGTKTTTSATSTLTKTVSSSTSATKTTSSTASRSTVSSTLSKVTKKPTAANNSLTKPTTEVKQTKETVNKQITKTGTVGKSSSSSTTIQSKTSTIRNVSKTTKTVPGKPEPVVKSVPKPIKKVANNMVNGNDEGVRKDTLEQPKELAVSVENDQTKEGETIRAPVEAEKGVFEENHKETPAIDSGLASPESLESPQNGLVTNNASMQNDKNEIVFNQ